MVCPWRFFVILMGFLWHPSGISIDVLQCFYDILWDSNRLHMEFQCNSSGISKYFHWIPMGFLQESFRISIIFLSSSDDISLKLLSDFRRIPMGIDKDFCSLFMVFPQDSYGNSIGFSWSFYGIPMAILMVVLWDFFGFWDFVGFSFGLSCFSCNSCISLPFLEDQYWIPVGFP